MNNLWSKKMILQMAVAAAAVPGTALAGDSAAQVVGAAATYVANNTWMLVSTFLVFIMHLGFATLEVGLTRAKNTVNILFKNTAIVAIGRMTPHLERFDGSTCISCGTDKTQIAAGEDHARRRGEVIPDHRRRRSHPKAGTCDGQK